jgi:hypothetical protein
LSTVDAGEAATTGLARPASGSVSAVEVEAIGLWYAVAPSSFPVVCCDEARGHPRTAAGLPAGVIEALAECVHVAGVGRTPHDEGPGGGSSHSR